MPNDNRLLNVLAREGVLVDVSVRYWRAAKKLKAEDLGLAPDDVTDRLFSLGHKKLVPKDALKPFSLIESRAHSLVESTTFAFLGGIGRYLPNNLLAKVSRGLDELEAEFVQARDRFLAGYGELRVEAARQWWEAARRLVSDPDRLVATIEESFPDAEAMAGYFSFRTHFFQVSVPDSATQAELIDAADHRAVAEARERAARQAAERIRSGTEEFVRDCVATMREETAKLCEEMLASMQGGKTRGVHQKTLNRLVNFIDQFKQLNFAGDGEMHEQLERVRREFLSRTAEEYRDDAHAQARLRNGIEGLAQAARQLATRDTTQIVERFGQMGRRRFHLAA